MRALQRFDRFGSDAQCAEARALPDSVRKQRLAILMMTRSALIGNNTEIHSIRVDADQAAVAAAKEMKLHAVIQSLGSVEMRLERDVTVTVAPTASQAGLSRHDRIPSIGADDPVSCGILLLGCHLALVRRNLMDGCVLEDVHTAGTRVIE